MVEVNGTQNVVSNKNVCDSIILKHRPMKKFISLTLLFVSISYWSPACPVCNQAIRNAIYNSTFYPNLFTMLSAFFVLAIVVAILIIITTKWHKNKLAANPSAARLSPVPLTTASLVLGIGLGGFADGIVLHQILQVHEMLSNKIDATNYIGKSVNMFWDGIFHFFCFLVVFAGIVLLWRLVKRSDVDHSGTLLAAGLIGGWGLFNLIEGLIDHQWLKLHNVVEFAANHTIGNSAFLCASVVMLMVSFVLFQNENKKRYKVIAQ